MDLKGQWLIESDLVTCAQTRGTAQFVTPRTNSRHDKDRIGKNRIGDGEESITCKAAYSCDGTLCHQPTLRGGSDDRPTTTLHNTLQLVRDFHEMDADAAS